MKVDPQGTTALYSALVPIRSITALTVDAKGNLYAAGPLAGPGIAAAKIDPAGQQLLYFSSIPGPGTSTAASGIVADSSGAAYIAGTITGSQVPEAIQSTRLQPNAFVIKIDPTPDQSDLRLEVQSIGALISGEPVTELFTISNDGPGAAQNVIFSATPPQGIFNLIGCRASASGSCGTDPQAPWASFPSISAGGSATVILTFSALAVTLNATVSGVTSDTRLDNNSISLTVGR